MFEQIAPSTPMHFAGAFKASPENFFDSESIELDIVRSGEDVAIVVVDAKTGYRMSSLDGYTNKTFTPPAYKEGFALNAYDLVKRQAGNDPFQDPNVRAALIDLVMRNMRTKQEMIRRAIEIQASQVFQTGTLSLTNEAGTVLYTLDFKPKSAHFFAPTIKWTSTGNDKKADLTTLANLIRANGQGEPNVIELGELAWDAFIADEDIQKLLDNRRIDIGNISRAVRQGDGSTYHGTIELGPYTYDLVTYSGKYKHPQTGVMTDYLDPKKVVMRATSARMDLVFGNIPNIGEILGAGARQRLLPELPSRFPLPGTSMDIHTNVWLDQTQENLMCGIGCRPLCIPTQIDSFGCMTVLD